METRSVPVLRSRTRAGPALRSDAVKTSELNDQGVESWEVGPDTEPARRVAALVVAAVDDRKGVDPVALDVSKLTELTDTMVIVTGTSNRHVKAIVDNVLLAAKRSGAEILGTEGREENDWVLIDLADVVVHVMSTEARRFYDLERLWEQPERSVGQVAASKAGAQDGSLSD